MIHIARPFMPFAPTTAPPTTTHIHKNTLYRHCVHHSYVIWVRVTGVYMRQRVHARITWVTNELSSLLQWDMLPTDSPHKGPVMQTFHGWDILAPMWYHYNVEIARECLWGCWLLWIFHNRACLSVAIAWGITPMPFHPYPHFSIGYP